MVVMCLDALLSKQHCLPYCIAEACCAMEVFRASKDFLYCSVYFRAFSSTCELHLKRAARPHCRARVVQIKVPLYVLSS